MLGEDRRDHRDRPIEGTAVACRSAESREVRPLAGLRQGSLHHPGRHPAARPQADGRTEGAEEVGHRLDQIAAAGASANAWVVPRLMPHHADHAAPHEPHAVHLEARLPWPDGEP
jgi:hypothetical protein